MPNSLTFPFFFFFLFLGKEGLMIGLQTRRMRVLGQGKGLLLGCVVQAHTLFCRP